ncbi:hypothetical protein KUCAC02_005903 [Chaenocephalus aceratus]|uniref:Uncharacterized protein n=1 Tax=Chaenocephalus aceratus TaxID=36190 RepID=A0ACB9WRI7_CHAAC|nr:hypothetical protein KUCAC02_005903 [Chaenocephalus aceratus]
MGSQFKGLNPRCWGFPGQQCPRCFWRTVKVNRQSSLGTPSNRESGVIRKQSLSFTTAVLQFYFSTAHVICKMLFEYIVKCPSVLPCCQSHV